MKLIVQRVKYASCMVEGKVTGKIDLGYMILVGFGHADTKKEVERLADKVSKLRIFDDENGKMNLDIHTVNGSILSISQFTLYGDCTKGNRPSFTDALEPEKASELYDYFNEVLESKNIKVEKGIFGADMKIELLNDGPVTFILE